MEINEILEKIKVAVSNNFGVSAEIEPYEKAVYWRVKDPVDSTKYVTTLRITPSKLDPPGRPSTASVIPAATDPWRRLVVSYWTKFGSFKGKGYYSLNSNGIFSPKMKEDVRAFMEISNQGFSKLNADLESSRKAEAEKESDGKVLMDKIKQRKMSAAQRAEMFTSLLDQIKNGAVKGKIESSQEDEHINITLDNAIKIKVQAESNCALIHSIEFNNALKPEDLFKFINKLSEVKS